MHVTGREEKEGEWGDGRRGGVIWQWNSSREGIVRKIQDAAEWQQQIQAATAGQRR